MHHRPAHCLIAMLALCHATYSEADDGPLPGIVFVSDDIFGPRHEAKGMPRHGTSHWREGYLYHRATTLVPLEWTAATSRPGRNLYTLIPADPRGRLTRITHLTSGEVFDPEPSYDGRRILFSMRRDGEDWFNLYEIGTDGAGLIQLTDGPFNDFSGVYLPDGRIVFVSDRSGYLEEYHEERTETLWAMNADGSGIEQLTFNPGTVFDPTVLADGRVLFSLWDTFLLNVPPADKHETYLMTIRPDGTEESHFFGAGEHRFFGRERHSGVALTQAGQMPDGTVLALSEMGPSIVDPRRGRRAIDALWPVFPCATTVQLGGATHRVHLSPIGSRTTPYPLPDGRFLFAATQPGERDLGVYLGDPATRRTRLVFNDPARAEFDPRPILLARPRPKILPRKEHLAATARQGPGGTAAAGRATFVVANARRSDNPEHQKALQRARYFRVVEALHTAVTSSSHTNLATRILGEVPILPDGSACFEAPADTPLYLEPVDAAGRRLEFDWRLPETSVPDGSKQNLLEMTYITARPGEIKSCNGCHAAQQESPSATCTMAAREHRPVQVDRDPSDLLYRRNDPEEYRSTARLGEAPGYRAWLANPDAALRRRGCESLALVQDAGPQDAVAVATLLTDGSAGARRAAARALARLGSADQLPALVDALGDQDWQVRFAAATACEAITACRQTSEVCETSEVFSPAAFYRGLLARLGGSEGVKRAIGQGPGCLQAWNNDGPDELRRRWFEAAGRLRTAAPESARQVVREALSIPLPPPVRFEPMTGKRYPLEGSPPELGAIRAAGAMKDAAAVPLLIPWLSRHEYPDHVRETAVSLGRIASPDAVAALWEALRREAPNRAPFMNRYFQHGPLHGEYALLRGLLLAGAAPALDDVPLVIGLLPGTFLEKPRFEDRLRPETQRVLLGRLMLQRASLRQRAVAILVDVLRGRDPAASDPLYEQILKGINLERPFAEHGRLFPVVKRIEPEQALWLLGCLTIARSEVPEGLVVPYLASANWRERIDAAVLLNRLGFGPRAAEALAAEALAAEADKPYPFPEIMGIGKSHDDPNYRDKCYMVMALAHHAEDVGRLRTFLDPKRRYRDVRYGLAVGLGQRGTPDGIELLTQLATRDPIAVVRRRAIESLMEVQDAERVAGRPVPSVRPPPAMPFEAWYRPRGLKWPGPVVEPLPAQDPAGGETLAEIDRRIAEAFRAENFRNLNNGNNQAPGASRMMIRGMASLVRAAEGLAALSPQDARPALQQLLTSPYPFAQYLAIRGLDDGRLPDMERQLIGLLDKCEQSSDTVRFFWTCEVLADRRAKTALPILARLVRAADSPYIHGPPGMGRGYPAARAIARLAADLAHPEVRRLLASENVWIRAGALSGLTEARAPGIEQLLKRLLKGHEAALIRNHARVGIRLLNEDPP
jgi:HEAT repeat protein